MENPHEILGVRDDASPEEVKKAFREGAKRTHPDLNHGGDEHEFKRLLAAYNVLSAKTTHAHASHRAPQQQKRAAPPEEARRGPTTVFRVGPSPLAMPSLTFTNFAVSFFS